MQNFLRSLFTNRFGLILAIINLALITFVRSGGAALLGMEQFKNQVFMMNLPARLVSVIFTGLVFEPMRPGNRSFLTYYPLDMVILVFLQWLLIGWLAQKIAKAIRSGWVSAAS